MRCSCRMFRLALFLLIFTTVSCGYIDIGGLFVSSYVNDRFADSTTHFPISPPTVADNNNFNFLVIADTHYYREQPGFLAFIESKKVEWDIEFVIILGDIVQSGLPEQYQFFLDDKAETTLPVYTIPGNHDLYNNGYSEYARVMGPTIYAFSIGNYRFIFLDSANGTLGSKQTTWLRNELSTTSSQARLLFSHYSFFDQLLQSPTVWSSSDEKYMLIDLFDRENVNIHFSGHLHFYDSRVVRGVRYINCNDLQYGTVNTHFKVTVSPAGIAYQIMQ